MNEKIVCNLNAHNYKVLSCYIIICSQANTGTYPTKFNKCMIRVLCDFQKKYNVKPLSIKIDTACDDMKTFNTFMHSKLKPVTINKNKTWTFDYLIPKHCNVNRDFQYGNHSGLPVSATGPWWWEYMIFSSQICQKKQFLQCIKCSLELFPCKDCRLHSLAVFKQMKHPINTPIERFNFVRTLQIRCKGKRHFKSKWHGLQRTII